MNDGGPAFPNSVAISRNANHELMVWDSQDRGLPGMTLLDYMAGQALAAFCCHTDVNATKAEVAKWAYEMGEQMLAERARRYAAAKETTR